MTVKFKSNKEPCITYKVINNNPVTGYDEVPKKYCPCPNCGGTITGLAQYWSKDDSFSSCWFERVDYDPCECTDQEEFDEEEDDELMEDYFKSIS